MFHPNQQRNKWSNEQPINMHCCAGTSSRPVCSGMNRIARIEIGILVCAGLSCLVRHEGHPSAVEQSRKLGRELADRHTSGGPSAPIPRGSRRHRRDWRYPLSSCRGCSSTAHRYTGLGLLSRRSILGPQFVFHQEDRGHSSWRRPRGRRRWRRSQGQRPYRPSRRQQFFSSSEQE